jgi:hypothetical protein
MSTENYLMIGCQLLIKVTKQVGLCFAVKSQSGFIQHKD